MNNKEEVKIGDRIKLLHTDDRFVQLKPGDLGTVWDTSIFNIETDVRPVRVIWLLLAKLESYWDRCRDNMK